MFTTLLTTFTLFTIANNSAPEPVRSFKFKAADTKIQELEQKNYYIAPYIFSVKNGKVYMENGNEILILDTEKNGVRKIPVALRVANFTVLQNDHIIVSSINPKDQTMMYDQNGTILKNIINLELSNPERTYFRQIIETKDGSIFATVLDDLSNSRYVHIRPMRIRDTDRKNKAGTPLAISEFLSQTVSLKMARKGQLSDGFKHHYCAQRKESGSIFFISQLGKLSVINPDRALEISDRFKVTAFDTPKPLSYVEPIQFPREKFKEVENRDLFISRWIHSFSRVCGIASIPETDELLIAWSNPNEDHEYYGGNDSTARPYSTTLQRISIYGDSIAEVEMQNTVFIGMENDHVYLYNGSEDLITIETYAYKELFTK